MHKEKGRRGFIVFVGNIKCFIRESNMLNELEVHSQELAAIMVNFS